MTRRARPVRVLVVEDSAVVKDLLLHIISLDPQIEVVGTAADGEEAIKAVQRVHPDVVTMDINMPRMNGLEATRRIMETCPTPIVIVSGSLMHDEVSTTFQALEAGALAVVGKPTGMGHADFADNAKDLTQTVKLMSEVKVVRRWPKRPASIAGTRTPSTQNAAQWRPEMIAIGSSTGGPLVLKTILSGLAQGLPVPILIVQHIAPGFSEGFAEWLAQATGFAVRLATHGERIQPGTAYLAPDAHHMQVRSGNVIALNTQPPEHGHRPSVSHLFRSVAATAGRDAVGVLLTGMGRDGAEELRAMKDCGALTIAQDQETSIVHGMPGEAIRLGGATHVLPPERMASVLLELFK